MDKIVVVKVNLLGSMRVIKKCLPLLKAGQGRIINVSSVAGLFGYPGIDFITSLLRRASSWITDVAPLWKFNKFSVPFLGKEYWNVNYTRTHIFSSKATL